VDFELKEWSAGGSLESKALVVKRQIPAVASMAQPITVVVDIEKSVYAPFLTIEDGIPANTVVDTRSLELLKQQGIITDYQVTDQKLRINLVSELNTIQVRYKLNAIHLGTAQHPGLTVLDDTTGAIVGRVQSADLLVK